MSGAYVTGSHAMKIGVDVGWGSVLNRDQRTNGGMNYNFLNGAPTSIAMVLSPRNEREREHHIGVLRTGSVDDQASDRERRSPLRLSESVGPRAGERARAVRAVPDLGGGQGHRRLEGSVAAARRFLRPVRRRQDRPQGDGQPLHRPRQHRVRHRQQSAAVQRDGHAVVDERCEPRLRAAGERARAAVEPELRHRPDDHRRGRPASARAGACAPTTGRSPRACSARSSRGLGERRLLPALVRQLRRHRQPVHHAGRLRRVLHHGARPIRGWVA